MNTVCKIVNNVVAVGLVAALTASCSAEAKKNRIAHRAEEYYKAGDYERAKIEYTNLLRADPRNPDPYEKIGRMWLEEGAPMRAGAFMARAKELAPGRAEIRTKLAELYIAVGALAEARQEALEALRLAPGNADALVILADTSRTPEEIAEAEAQVSQNARPDNATFNVAKATIALRKGDLAGVDEALTRAIAVDPKSAMAHAALARLRFQQGNKEAAAAEFKTAADLAPPRAAPQLFYAEFKIQTGAEAEAAAHMNEVVKKAPDYLPAWIMLAKIASHKSYDEALALLENVFRRDAQNFDARMLQSDFLLLKGDAKSAVETMKQLESAFPKVPAVKFQLARAFLQGGDPAQAITSLTQALALAPDYADATLLLAEINLRNNTPAPVIVAMEDFLKKSPHNVRAEVMLADAYRASGRFDEAGKILQELVDRSPDRPEPYLLLGVLLRQQNKPLESRTALEKAAQLDPNNFNALNQLTELDIEAKNFPAALKRITEGLEKTPDSAALHLLEGKIYVAQRDWNRAEAALLKVMELNANIPNAYELLVSTYIGANKLPQAVTQLEAYLAKAPNNIGALMTLALVYSEMKDYTKARDTYEKLLANRPDIVVAMNNLAYIYSDQLNQLDKASEWAGKAHSADPGNASVADTFGWILYRQGDYKQAANVLKEAAEKLPNEPEVQHHYGMASYMMGDRAAARVAFESATRSQKDFPGKDEARRRLELLNGNTAQNDEMTPAQLQGLLKEQPNDPLAMTQLADAYARQGDSAKAAELYEQAIKVNPTLAAPTMKLAQLYAGPLQKKDRALQLAKKARDLAPGDANTTAVLGRLAFQIGNFPWAYSLLQESSRQLVNDTGVQRDFAWAAYSIGKVGDARQTMERIVKANPDSSESTDAKTFLRLTAPAVMDGDPTTAVSDAQAALVRDATYAPALFVQARISAARGDRAAAAKAYNDILARFPDFAPAQKALAAVYLDDPDNRIKALELATNARKTLPDDPELAAILGQASYFKKDYSRAVQLLKESDRKKPLDAKRLYFLGLSLVELKQIPAANDALKKAVTGGLPEPLASDANKVLGEIATKE